MRDPELPETHLRGENSTRRPSRTRPGSPPSLLLTLLGDYWWGQTEPLPSAGLVDLLGDFGVTDVAARAALSRLLKHGLLTNTRVGRRTFYRLTDRALSVLDSGAARIFAFGRGITPWSGQWSLLAFSVPESGRAARERLRARLRWLGFAPLYDGLWVSPRDRHNEALDELRSLGIKTATAFQARVCKESPLDSLPQTAWDLGELAALYGEFIVNTRELRADLGNGEVDPVTALVKRTRLMDDWRTFPALDPELPPELLPSDWPRPEARDLFFETYEALGVPASERVRQVLSKHAPEIASFAVPHRLLAEAPVGRDS